MADYTGLEIAIIGMACKYPGANNYHEFWENLKNGRESIAFYENEELIADGVPRALVENADYVKANAQIKDREAFDFGFFGFTPNEAKQMNPQAYVLHETVWSALEDAGYIPDQVKGKVGVYCGSNSSFEAEIKSYLMAQLSGKADMSTIFLADKDYISTSIAYKFNLTGPATSLDTACSTSLVAIHLACQGLLNGDCNMAIAGGVALQPDGKVGYLYKEGMIYSKDGHTRPFDAEATGTINADGAGIVILKLLENALEDNDHIHAIIRGTAINNDGNGKVGYTAPSARAQANVIRSAHIAAGVTAQQVSYMAAHGSGTSVGDPIEISGMIQAFGNTSEKYCKVGSLKANIGHTVHAAGVANMIKVVMAFKDGVLPPTINFKRLNPLIDLKNSPFSINTRLSDWETGQNKRIAGVSSFGIGGTNAHAVLEEPPLRGDQPVNRLYAILTVSGRSFTSLENARLNLLHFLQRSDYTAPYDLAYTMAAGRKHFPYREAIVFKDIAEAIAKLSEPLQPALTQRQVVTDNVFVFPGLGMDLRELTLQLIQHEGSFRRNFVSCADAIKKYSQFDIVDYLRADFNAGLFNITPLTIEQLLTFAFQYAHSRLLMETGIRPSAMLGYSFGEYTVACLAGVISMDDTIRLLLKRGELISSTPAARMISVPLEKEKLLVLLNGFDISIAIDNRDSCVIAATEAEMQKAELVLKSRRLMFVPLKGRYGIHSHLMNDMIEEFGMTLKSIEFKSPAIPYLSCVTGTWITAGEATSANYWIRHLRETMQFVNCIENLIQKPSLYTVIGPGFEISSIIARFLMDDQRGNIISCPVNHLTGEAIGGIYYQLGKLWAKGAEINWDVYYHDEPGKRIPLPTYPFEGSFLKDKRSVADLIKMVSRNYSDPSFAEGQNSTANIAVTPGASDLSEVKLARPSVSTQFSAPVKTSELAVADIWENFFGYQGIGIDDNFLELGGDSLKAVIITQKIQKEFQVSIPIATFFQENTIRKLAAYLEKAERVDIDEIMPVTDRVHYPLLPAQKLIYQAIKNYGNENYVLNRSVDIKGPLDIARFEKALNRLIELNEGLRTGILPHGEDIVQKVYPYYDYKLAFNVIEPNALPELTYSAIDTGQYPLFDFKLYRYGMDSYRFYFRISHLIADGLSQLFLIQQFFRLYDGEVMEPNLLHFKDYAVWKADRINQSALSDKYWRAQFDAAAFSTTGKHTYSNKPESFTLKLPDTLRSEIKKSANRENISFNIFLLTCYSLHVASYRKAGNMMIGLVVDARDQDSTVNMVGMFSRLLPLLMPGTEVGTLHERFKVAGEYISSSYDQRNFPFENVLLDEIADKKIPYPFDFIMQLHDVVDAVHSVGNTTLKFENDKYLLGYIPSFMKLDIFNQADTLDLVFTYNSEAIDSDSAMRFGDGFTALLKNSVEEFTTVQLYK